MEIRVETKKDIEGVYKVNERAFETNAEAKLVNSLRANVDSVFTLVAVEGDNVIGQVTFSPMSIETERNIKVFGLAPLAVDPKYQNKGVGTKLVEAGLDECKTRNISAVFVLGHPSYYPRFGFKPSIHFGINSEYEVLPEVFMGMELVQGALSDVQGLVRYCGEFKNV